MLDLCRLTVDFLDMGMIDKESKVRMQIGIKQNPQYPEIEVKLGENQFSRHSHIHQVWSFSYVLHGKTVVSLGTWQSELVEDQFITIPPGIPHLCSPETDNPFSFVVLYVPFEYLDVHAPEFLQPRVGKIDSTVVFHFIDLLIQSVSRKELETNSDKLQKFLDKNSSLLDVEWGMNLLGEENNFTLTLPHGSRFQRYRYTRKRFGIGQKKISTIEKMEQAKELMSEGLDLVEIALKCGFYDQSHFSKVFKLYTGLTPAQYIKK